jgi:hypothetical protein
MIKKIFARLHNATINIICSKSFRFNARHYSHHSSLKSSCPLPGQHAQVDD